MVTTAFGQAHPHDKGLVSRRARGTICGVLCYGKWTVAALALILVIAGCSTPDPKLTRLPDLTTASVPEPMAVAPAAPLPPPAPAVAPPAQTNVSHQAVEPPPVAPEPTAPVTVAGRPWPSSWINAWVPLESWGKYNGLPKPVQLSAGKEPLYQLQSSNGLLLVKIGSPSVNIGGIQFGLGFAPRLIRGLPYIHSLDAQKTLQAVAQAFFNFAPANRTIVIDAGHGGRDSGTLSSIGIVHEKDFALDWARRLAPLLRARGWHVVMTRTNDAELTLADRVALADRVNADLFLSLHFNSGLPNRDLMGLETYCLTPTGLPSNIIRDDEDNVREAHPNNAFDEQNIQLASRLHGSLLRASGAFDRGVRRARFMGVLRHQNRPAVLIEGGYLSNIGEAKRIASPDYRQLLAEGVARALE